MRSHNQWWVHSKVPRLPGQHRPVLARSPLFCATTCATAPIGHNSISETSLATMDSSSSKMLPQTSLFQVYLRLRPALPGQLPKPDDEEPWLLVEPPTSSATSENDTRGSVPTHITLQPPNDSRKRAVEKFGFTKVFQEEATQLDILDSTGTVQLVKSVLSSGRDGLVATLGVTGSGKVYWRNRCSTDCC
jgi:Kinesin motor domain